VGLLSLPMPEQELQRLVLAVVCCMGMAVQVLREH
jgi:hypothetical protein